jgi:dipeptidyl aminopeptidase/acylaminoacyl peptidase
LTRGACALALALLLCGCSAGPSAPGAQIARYSPAQFYATTTFVGAAFSTDETRILLSANATGVFNVYAQRLGGGRPLALTKSTTDSTFAVAYFPADDRFLFTADQGGNELNHLFVQDPSGNVVDLTPGEKLKAAFLGFSSDRQSFYVETNERDPRTFDVYRYAVDGYARERMFENDGRYLPAGVSRNGRWLALAESISNTRTDLWVVDLATGKRIRVTPDVDANHGFFTFTPNSRQLIYSTDEFGQFDQAWSYDLASGARAVAIKADWDVVFVGYSEQGRYRVSALNADARTVVTLRDLERGSEVELTGLPAGDIRPAAFSRSESKFAFYLTSDTAPANLYVRELDGSASRQLTSSLPPAIDEDVLVAGSDVRFTSFDGLEIPAILWRPRQASARHRAPALVLVHGGPGGQTRHGWSADVQALVNHGYAVLGVNNRGSSGYGKTFFHADDRRHGDVDLKDCVWGKRYLESLDWIDADRIAIMGGSYGGYMVAAALAFEPTEFAAGIDVFGVTNWLRTLQSIPPWWTAQRTALYDELGDPATDADRLKRISPLFHANDIVRPLLVMQGKNDPRVLKMESDELVAAVRGNGVPVEYVVFDDEGHGFTKSANRITALGHYLDFLAAHLGGD